MDGLLVLLFILGVAVILALWIFIAKWFENAAADKGYTNDHVFARVFWLGFFGILYTIALPDKTVQRQNEEIISLLKEIKRPLAKIEK